VKEGEKRHVDSRCDHVGGHIAEVEARLGVLGTGPGYDLPEERSHLPELLDLLLTIAGS